MEITVNITRADLLKLTISRSPKMKSNWIAFFFVWVLIGFSYYHGEFFERTNQNYIVLVLTSAFVAFCCLLFGLLFSFICILASAKTKNGILGEHHYTIQKEGLYEENSANQTLSKWGGILDIIQTKKYILVQISPMHFHLIPSRSFSTTEEFNKFYNQLNQAMGKLNGA